MMILIAMGTIMSAFDYAEQLKMVNEMNAIAQRNVVIAVTVGILIGVVSMIYLIKHGD